mmetsp:Transcript_44683/g.104896  ORF Transcript_44683/g.104896 Transcript_44683/m.104896 type:complete len:267 (+) Transcript_44683:190-990(+)
MSHRANEPRPERDGFTYERLDRGHPEGDLGPELQMLRRVAAFWESVRSRLRCRSNNRLRFCLLLSLWLYGAVMIMLVIAVLQGGSQVFIMAFLGVLTGISIVTMRLRAEAMRQARRGMSSHEELLRSLEEGRVTPQMVRGTRLAMMTPLEMRLSLTNRDFNANDYEALLALDETARVHRGAEQVQINRLPAYTVKADSKAGNCSICLEVLAEGHNARILPCLHQFHTECIDRWLTDNATCPVCKMDPFVVEDLYESGVLGESEQYR